MPLHILGLNHNTAPVEIREQVIYSGDDIARALAALVQLQGIDEAVILSTCNRTEFYLEKRRWRAGGTGVLAQGDQSLSEDAEAALFTLIMRRPFATCFAWLAVSTPWCSASRRSWDN